MTKEEYIQSVKLEMANIELKGSGLIAISHDEYDELQKESQFLCALQSAGVDNWIGYEDAQDIVEEWDKE